MSYNRLIQIDGKVAVPSSKNVITQVTKGSVAEELGVTAGDQLLYINEVAVKDILDYRFLTAAEEFSIVIGRRKEGEEEVQLISLQVHKDAYEDLGMDFETGIIDKAFSCSNNCVFCFIDQLPKGMRESLYFKDDDSRLAFLQGNFVTLTNMSDKDIDRIINYRISPINISVHATDPQVRIRMLNNRTAGKLYERMERLAKARIQMNAQIVLVPEYNDGPILENTLKDLAKLHPYVGTVAIVPLGLTKYREGLPDLIPMDEKRSIEVLDQVRIQNEQFKKELGTNFARCADEFYVLAKREVPEEAYYEGYEQLEDGIGMIRLFHEAVSDSLQDLAKGQASFTFITGTSAFSHIEWAANKIAEQSKGRIKTNAYPIDNHFFGPSITVAGLLTGEDILEQLKTKKVHEYLIMPRNMFRTGEEILLDNVTLRDLEEQLKTTILVVDYTGEDLIETINLHLNQG